MKMVNRTNTVTHFQRIGFCQRAREPDLRLLHRIRPCGVTRTQRRQRRRERTARAVGVFGLDTWRGETLRAIVGEKPVRAFCIIKMAAFHQHRATPHRQQRIPLLFHLTFVLRVWRIQQRGGFRQVWRDQRNLRQQLLRRVSTAEAESSGSPLLASITVSSTTFFIW